jgi:eukaryotic-like serine/threonine-protein kinase
MDTPETPSTVDYRPSVESEGHPAAYPPLPGYELLGELGRGGMGVVYKARQSGLGRIVALKMILASGMSPKAMSRFRFEAESLARLNHPNIVQVYEIDEYQGSPFFSMEFVEGGTLAQQLSGNPQNPVAAAVLLGTVARAAHAAHLKGIVHRDLKPGNLLLTLERAPKIADFGLAKQRDDEEWLRGVTATGAVIGTPEYMAPEQARGDFRDITPRTDVYALGAILYKMLTGRPPFKGVTTLDTLTLILTHDPVSPRSMLPTVPLQLETICMKCLRKEASQRYSTALTLAEELHQFTQGGGESQRKKWWHLWK